MLVLVMTGATVIAQTTPSTPSGSQLEQERARIESERKSMFSPNNPATQGPKGGIPAQKAIEKEMGKIEGERKAMFDKSNPDTANAKNVFPNIEAPERAQIDLEALAKRYEQKAEARKSDGLMVFASFSMPAVTLKKLIGDTKKAGGVLVLNGFFEGSMKKTGQAINALGQGAGGVQINPKAFTKYRIKAVPAVVLIKPDGSDLVDTDGCALPEKYVMVAGDVGLSYALEQIELRSAEFKSMAERYARPLKGATR